MLYCTRTDVHVDRCASAWLIKRFVDKDAVFVFVDSQTAPADTIPFDMIGAAYGHHHGKCSFEAIAEMHCSQNPIITQIAAIIHGADITADADETLESPGVNLVFRGLRMVCASDQETLERGYVIMDALYAALENAPTSPLR